jgi:hypothetical protein
MGIELVPHAITQPPKRQGHIAGFLSKVDDLTQASSDLRDMLEKHTDNVSSYWAELEPLLDMNIQLTGAVSNAVKELSITVAKQASHAEHLKAKVKAMVDDNASRVRQITGDTV